jgi:allantoinase
MKKGDDAFSVWGGIAGVQSTLESLLTRWMDRCNPLRELGRLIAGNAADRFRIGGKGRIALGLDGDLSLVDTNERFMLSRDMLLDRHKLSPYVGRTFRGKVVRTILRGHTIFENGIMIGPPRGRFVRPERRA